MIRMITPCFMACLAANSVHAEPMTVKGIHPGMTRTEVVAAIMRRGGRCDPVFDPLGSKGVEPEYYAQYCWSAGKFFSDISIKLSPLHHVEAVHLTCHATSTCDFRTTEIAAALQQDGIIEDFARSSSISKSLSHPDDLYAHDERTGGTIFVNIGKDGLPYISVNSAVSNHDSPADFD